MECPICFSEFDTTLLTPQIIPCGHSICYSCINDLYRSDNRECPIDRNPLPDQGMIKPNFALIELMQKGTKEEDVLFCCNGHRLQDLVGVGGECEICKKNKNSLWLCMACQSGVCGPCKDWFYSSHSIRNSGAKCFSGHSLRFTQNPGAFYKRQGKFLCDGCKVIVDGSSGQCRTCSVDYCALCLRKLNEMINMRIFLSCSCGKQVVWRSNDICGRCSKCRERFDKSGSFKCISCQKKSCLPCTYKSN